MTTACPEDAEGKTSYELSWKVKVMLKKKRKKRGTHLTRCPMISTNACTLARVRDVATIPAIGLVAIAMQCRRRERTALPAFPYPRPPLPRPISLAHCSLLSPRPFPQFVFGCYAKYFSALHWTRAMAARGLGQGSLTTTSPSVG